MGALTSKPYAFNARPWELQSFESIDLGDSVGSSIRMDARGSTILRVLPTLNEFLNEEWINDRTRFSYDGLASQRLVSPLVRVLKSDVFSKVSWSKLFLELKAGLPLFDGPFDVLAGKTTSLEALAFAKHLFSGAAFISEGDALSTNYDFQSNYLFNSSYVNFALSDFFLVIGANLRLEAPSINLKVKRALKDNPSKKVFTAGVSSDLTYPSFSLGSLETFWPKFLTGRHKISRLFYKSVKPFLILNESSSFATSKFFSSVSAKTGLQSLLGSKGDWCGLNFLAMNASSNGFKDLSLNRTNFLNPLNSCYILGSDNVRFDYSSSNFVVYQGYNGDWGASNANIVIPTLHPYESNQSSYINLYGKIQSVFRSQFSSGGLVDDCTFFRYFSKFLNLYTLRRPPLAFIPKFIGFLRYIDFYSYSSRSANWALSACCNCLNIYPYLKTRKSYIFSNYSFSLSEVGSYAFNFRNSFHSYSFYLTDSVTRASHIMALTHRRFKSPTIFR